MSFLDYLRNEFAFSGNKGKKGSKIDQGVQDLQLGSLELNSSIST